MLKTSAKEFFSGNAPISSLRKLRDDKSELGYDQRVWNEMAEMGWTGLVFPEAYGGLDFGYAGLGQILIESGKTLTPSPMMSSVIVSGTLVNAFGSEDQKQDLLNEIVSGEKIVTLAFEENQTHNPRNPETSVDSNQLTGTKKFVLDGHVADIFLVTAKSQKGLGIYIIDASAAGVSVQRHIMMDSRNAATVVFEAAPVMGMIGLPGEGENIIDHTLDVARICLSAEMLGSMEEAFSRTINYLKERKQFGVSIGSFQGLQHRAAHMFCEIEMCKSIVLNSLQAIDDESDELAMNASMTKAKVGEVAKLVSNEGIQMFGGIGMTDDEEIGFFLKRARVAQLTFGDFNYHIDRYARLRSF